MQERGPHAAHPHQRGGAKLTVIGSPLTGQRIVSEIARQIKGLNRAEGAEERAARRRRAPFRGDFGHLMDEEGYR